jgi:hypothetical protein
MRFKPSGPLYILSAAALFSLVATAPGAPVLTNGNFETPQLASGAFTSNMNGTGWILEGGGAGGLVNKNAAGFLASPSDGGNQWCYLAPSSNGSLSEYLEQDIETNGVQAEKGKTINFSFEQYYQTNLGSTKPTDIQIRIQWGSDINNVIAFQTFSGLSAGQSALRTGSLTIPANFNKTGDLYIAFEAFEHTIPGSGPGNVSIDNVQIAVAPLPTSAAMGLCGLALVFAATRWQRRLSN